MAVCPYCEDYEGTVNQVVGHATSKTDDDHRGFGGNQVRATLEANGQVDGDEQSSQSGSEQSSEQSSERGSDPTMGSGSGSGSSSSSSSSGGCPSCSGDLDRDIEGTFYQPKDADAGQYIQAEEGDGLCLSCGLLVGSDGDSVQLEAQS